MSEQPEHPPVRLPERHKGFEDPHFHDDEDLVPPDDVDRPSRRPPTRRKPRRKLPNRRHYED